MSTAETLNPQLSSFFCHKCDRTVSLSPNPNSDLSCPFCHDGFLEELPNDPNPNPNFVNSFFPDPTALLSGMFSTPTTTTRRERFIVGPSSFFSSSSQPPSVGQGGLGFDQRTFIQSFLTNLGGNVQVTFESADGSTAIPPNMGDYISGEFGLEQFIQHIFDNDPNRHGTPPAAVSALEGLPSVMVGDEVVKSESNSCAVCMTDFELNSEVKQMPCKHLFHTECILPWLKMHNSCPVCRFELPTDDQDYEARKAGSGSQAGRTFNIPFPWPYNAFDGNSSGSSRGGGGASGPGAS